MKNIMDKNINAYQYQEAIELQFQSICEPLFGLGIKWFCHMKIFPNGSYLLVAPGYKEWIRQYLSTIKGQGASPTTEIESSPVGQSHYSIFSSLPNKRKDPVLHLMHYFNIWPVFCIYKNKGEFVEVYAFAMNTSEHYASTFYLNNLVLLEHFCDYFNERAKDIIECSDRRKLGYFEQQFNLHNNQFEENFRAQQIKQFLQETYIQKRHLKTGEEELLFSREEIEGIRYLSLGESVKEVASNLGIPSLLLENSLRTFKSLESNERTQKRSSHYLQTSLSMRQKECLFYLMKGYTAKQIAQQLELSYRTVETHIGHLKNKFNCTTKGQLIEAAFDNVFVNIKQKI